MSNLQSLANEVASQLSGSAERSLAIINSLVEKSTKMMQSGSTEPYVRDMLDGDGMGELIGGQEESAGEEIGERPGNEQTLRKKIMDAIVQAAKEKTGVGSDAEHNKMDPLPKPMELNIESNGMFEKYIAIIEGEINVNTKE